MELLDLFIVFAVGVLVGPFGSLVGGEALITIPLLIFLGLPPHIAIATNRLGLTGGLITSWYEFHRKRMIDYKIGFAVAIPALAGSILGASLVLHINEALLRKIIAILIIAVLAFVVARPQLGVEKTKYVVRTGEYVAGVIGSFFIGIYHGFYGAGAGSLFSYLLILLFGQTFLESAATRKIAASLGSLVAVAIFAIAGVIVYSVGIALLIGLSIGFYLGAHYSDKIGNVWIKRLFFVIVLIMAIKLLL